MSEIHPTMQRVYEMTKQGQSELGRSLNLSPQNIKNWEKRGISKEGLNLVTETFNLSADWVLTGDGSPYKNRPTVDELRKRIDEVRNGDLSVQDTELFEDIKNDVPVISWVAAGSWTEINPTTLDDVIEYLPRPRHLSHKGFALIIKGRSMWPEFKPNEIIFVEPMYDVFSLKDGDLVVVSCNDDSEATFKQLVIGETSDDIYLKPLNPEWPEQRLQPMGECRLVGKVIGKYVGY